LLIFADNDNGDLLRDALFQIYPEGKEQHSPLPGPAPAPSPSDYSNEVQVKVVIRFPQIKKAAIPS